MSISPHALVASNAELAPNVTVGPFALIGSVVGGESDGSVRIASGTTVGPHTVIYGDVTIGSRVSIDPFCRIGPYATIGDDCKLLYGARVHEDVTIGHHCVISGNCPDRTTLGDYVVHLGRIAHGFHHPFASDWDAPAEPGPTIGCRVAIGVDAIIVGPISIGDNTFVLPGEIVRESLPGNGIWRAGQWIDMPNWSRHLQLLQPFSGPSERAAFRRRPPERTE